MAEVYFMSFVNSAWGTFHIRRLVKASSGYADYDRKEFQADLHGSVSILTGFLDEAESRVAGQSH